MLAEAFVAASSLPAESSSANPPLLKDAGFFFHSFQNGAILRQTLKNTTSAEHGVAVSKSSIFIAQTGKALVNIYSRRNGAHQASVPLSQRITCVRLACGDTVLLLGCENGTLSAWELQSGRQTQTTSSHLLPLTCIATDSGNNHVLSGSADCTIHVWSLTSLLAINRTGVGSNEGSVAPIRTFSEHRGVVNAVECITDTCLTMAVSSSKDGTAIIWDFSSGSLLKRIILESTPLCVALDPAGRAAYLGCSDGSVQVLEFFAHGRLEERSIRNNSLFSRGAEHTPLQPCEPAMQRLGGIDKHDSVLCIAIGYDSTTLLTGHASGIIASWDVGRRAWNGILSEYRGAPITSLHVLPVIGLGRGSRSCMFAESAVKPKPHHAFSGPDGGTLCSTYTLGMDMQPSNHIRQPQTPNFTADVIDEAIAELFRGRKVSSTSSSRDSDWIALDPAHLGTSHNSSNELKNLQDQILHLRKLQATTNAHLHRLLREKDTGAMA